MRSPHKNTRRTDAVGLAPILALAVSRATVHDERVARGVLLRLAIARGVASARLSPPHARHADTVVLAAVAFEVVLGARLAVFSGLVAEHADLRGG